VKEEEDAAAAAADDDDDDDDEPPALRLRPLLYRGVHKIYLSIFVIFVM